MRLPELLMVALLLVCIFTLAYVCVWGVARLFARELARELRLPWASGRPWDI
jgi:hypothetical protein